MLGNGVRVVPSWHRHKSFWPRLFRDCISHTTSLLLALELDSSSSACELLLSLTWLHLAPHTKRAAEIVTAPAHICALRKPPLSLWIKAPAVGGPANDANPSIEHTIPKRTPNLLGSVVNEASPPTNTVQSISLVNCPERYSNATRICVLKVKRMRRTYTDFLGLRR
jgi:hypothetical protein